MKKNVLAALMGAALFGSAIASGPAFSWPSVIQRGTTLYNPEASYNCYTLFAPMESFSAPMTQFPLYLINMSGRVVHQWNVPFVPMHGRLLPNGNVVIQGLSKDQLMDQEMPRMKNSMGGYTDHLVELTWEGKTVFKYRNKDMHHDAIKLPNGNYLYLGWEVVPKPLRDKVRGGFKNTEHLLSVPPSQREAYFRSDAPGKPDLRFMFNDYLEEIDPKGRKVWTWHANQHLDPDIDIIGPIYRREEWLHSNSVGLTSDGDIVLASRNTDSILIVDRKTGEIIFRWGNVAHLDETTGRIEHYGVPVSAFAGAKVPRLGGPHDAQEIPAGLPGAGNLLVYNNGIYSGFSSAMEVNRITGSVVWETRHTGHGRRPMSVFMGSAQRLPNGNTLVNEGLNGRFYQMTRDNQIVWEYVDPFDASRLFLGAVFKIQAYSPDYCPQFKKLPAAAGLAIKPPPMIPADQIDSVRIAEHQAAQRAARQAAQRALWTRVAVGMLMLAIAAAAFYIGRRSARTS